MKTRVISFLLFLIFTLFAYWQFNDPDPVLWVGIYGILALVSLLRVFGIFSRGLAIVFMIALAVYSLFKIGGVIEWIGADDKSSVFGTMTPDKPYVELTREFLGLVLGFLGMFVHYKMKR